MKKTLTAAFVAATMMVGIGGASAVAAEKTQITSVDMPIRLLYNARQLPTDVQPESINGTALVPLRVVSDKLGGKLTLTGKSINIVKGKSTLALTIGSSTATINGKSTKLPVPVKVVSGRTLVPLRVVSEGLGVAVEWDSVLKFVWIGSKNVPELNDIVKPQEFKSFKEYYEGGPDYLLNGGYGVYTNATVVNISDFPFKSGANIYYRIDLAFDQKNKAYIQTIENTKSSTNPDYYFLSKTSNPTISYSLTFLRQIPVEGVHIYYNDLSKLGGKVSSFRDIDFIDSCHTINLFNGKSSELLIKNPWR